MHHNKKKLLIGIIVGLALFFGNSEKTDAAVFSEGKCQTFVVRPGGKLAIFTLVAGDHTLTPETDTQHADKVGIKDPQEGYTFCVEVGAASTTVLWKDLQLASGNNLKTEWQYQREVSEEHDRRPVCEVFNTGSSVAGNGVSWVRTQGEDQPAAIRYELVRAAWITGCPAASDKFMRQRYFFDIDDDKFLYFMRFAGEGESLPNPITACANHNTSETACKGDSRCYWLGSSCKAKADTSVKCADVPPAVCTTNVALHCKIGSNNQCVDRIIQISQSQAIEKFISSTYGMPEGYEGPLPECAFTGSCRSIEDLIGLGVKVANWLFSVIAGLAFVFFVYGGITMIMSFGNSEKVGQGKQILVAATVGLIITFSAYILISFVVKAIGIQSSLTPFN